jgi:hypothetical protein
LVATSERQSGIGKHCNYGGLKRQRFMHMEVNRIATIVWAIMKRIRITLEDENDDPIRRYFTPLLKASQIKFPSNLKIICFKIAAKGNQKPC